MLASTFIKSIFPMFFFLKLLLFFFVLSVMLAGNQACKGNRGFQIPRIGVADDRVAHYASIHYYVDKELQVNTLCIFIAYLLIS